ncbi:uncharacterized protein PHALS_07441 [Plasmopara halstedii]|uniref:Uncharacterized protein n=1 Tax=Plasmopara halstedii TaxID=4781 RepID=A0A0P1B651_PLAHL|nr:uncharacterized protein PHALS_07441 [Plasmopara halstedii]CEG49689.1 hypothetical protein PHALS_07441 [Plasmopara halstedii]|eukprot:XP_024586058.1 hypothetical protein PHALS_07441 [Plasmopara halstedii]
MTILCIHNPSNSTSRSTRDYARESHRSSTPTLLDCSDITVPYLGNDESSSLTSGPGLFARDSTTKNYGHHSILLLRFALTVFYPAYRNIQLLISFRVNKASEIPGSHPLVAVLTKTSFQDRDIRPLAAVSAEIYSSDYWKTVTLCMTSSILTTWLKLTLKLNLSDNGQDIALFPFLPEAVCL